MLEEATGLALPLTALLAVFAVGGWIVHKNHFAWEHGRWDNYEKVWREGNFARFAGQWEQIWMGSVVFASLAAIVSWVVLPYVPVGNYSINPYAGGNVYIPYLVGTFTFVAAFTGWTDIWVRKAPLEMSHLGLYALFPAAVFGIINPTLIPSKMPLDLIFGNLDNLAQFGFFAVIMPGLLFVLWLRVGGIGLADIRSLWMAAFAFGWWLGAENMILLALVSIFVQLLAGIPANIFKWGELRPSPLPGLRKAVNAAFSGIARSERKLWPDQSRALPWLPAIGLTYTVGPIVLLLAPSLLV